jgi:hypothetical protein
LKQAIIGLVDGQAWAIEQAYELNERKLLTRIAERAA